MGKILITSTPLGINNFYAKFNRYRNELRKNKIKNIWKTDGIV
jgi:hypothetical protein